MKDDWTWEHIIGFVVLTLITGIYAAAVVAFFVKEFGA